ncbi:citryl-CoA lyase [Ramlibacter sp. AW1]|uniref:citrate synthase (unknown stereospecificity) n=1 Tax=Ramlibacter aurantiacus TaxID=2801330 RepID=A0A936ZRK1_9BURK|nr:citryl-CoA lyase [Ramlibacter aurantiacus]MBL0419369.1 citryl-CoA lyase [Ramlibacter aurantiacus]
MTRPKKPLRSTMASSTATTITVQGMDLMQDIMGRLNLGDYAFLEIQRRLPTPGESVVFNAMLATLVEHGMTPMAIATRLTYLGAPESLQGAVASGLLGMGTTFAGTAEGSARLLQEALAGDAANTPDEQLPMLATSIVERLRATRTPIPGIGHNLHKPVDPRAPRLFELAAEHGLSGRYVKLMQHIATAAEQALNKPGQLPVNATGALGALCSEMQIPWKLCRGLAVIGRAVGLVGHIAEELHHPIAREIWERTEEECATPTNH